MWTLAAACLALCGVIWAGYLSNFVAEDYRRFRDGGSLAAAMAGELKSYVTNTETIRSNIAMLISGIESAEVNIPKMQRFNVFVDPIYESSIKQIGLLGPILAMDVAFIYRQLRNLREGYSIVINDMLNEGGEVSLLLRHQAILQLKICIQINDDIGVHGVSLLNSLIDRSGEQYILPNPMALIKFPAIKLSKFDGEKQEY